MKNQLFLYLFITTSHFSCKKDEDLMEMQMMLVGIQIMGLLLVQH